MYGNVFNLVIRYSPDLDFLAISRRAGAEIARLGTELERYLVQMRDRQAQTRSVAAPPARPGELELLHRPAAMNMRGRPDLTDPLLETDWFAVFSSASRWRRQQLQPRTVEREEPGRRSNMPELELEAKHRAREAESKKCRPVQWLINYVTKGPRRAWHGEGSVRIGVPKALGTRRRGVVMV